MAKVNPYELIMLTRSKEEALKNLRKAAEAENHAEAVEILIVAYNGWGISSEEMDEALTVDRG